MKYFYENLEEAQLDLENFDLETKDLLHFSVFKNSIRLFWTSIFMRYLIRPRDWFSGALQQISYKSLVLGKIINPQPNNNGGENNDFTNKNSSENDGISILKITENDGFSDFDSFGQKNHENVGNITKIRKHLNEIVVLSVDSIPLPYLSMHVRYVRAYFYSDDQYTCHFMSFYS